MFLKLYSTKILDLSGKQNQHTQIQSSCKVYLGGLLELIKIAQGFWAMCPRHESINRAAHDEIKQIISVCFWKRCLDTNTDKEKKQITCVAIRRHPGITNWSLFSLSLLAVRGAVKKNDPPTLLPLLACRVAADPFAFVWVVVLEYHKKSTLVRQTKHTHNPIAAAKSIWGEGLLELVKIAQRRYNSFSIFRSCVQYILLRRVCKPPSPIES